MTRRLCYPVLIGILVLALATTTTVVKAQCSILNDTSLKPAVDSWMSIHTREEAEETYGGHISQWDVSCCKKFDTLFKFSNRFAEDLSGWQTSQVTSMDRLFEVADRFTGDVSTWDTSNVRRMNRIFHRSSLFSTETTGVSKWNTSNLRDLRYGFSAAAGFDGSLTGWDTSKVQDFDHMFASTYLFAGDVSDWNLESVTSLDHVFHLSEGFKGEISGWNFSDSLQTIRYAFSEVKDFNPLDKDGQPTTSIDWYTGNVRDMSFLLQGAKNFNSDFIANWLTPNLTMMTHSFSKTENLHGTLQSAWTTSKLSSFASMFATSKNFTSPLVTNFDSSNVIDMNSIFKFTRDFGGDVSQWNTTKVETLEDCAYESVDFQGVGIANWDVSSVTSLTRSFGGVQNFPPNLIAKWNTTSLFHVRDTFKDAEWATSSSGTVGDDEDHGETNPYPICWELNKAAHFTLEEATCSSPGIGFDCDCINLDLADIINAECKLPTPPCVGEVPTQLESISADAQTDFSENDKSSSPSSKRGFPAEPLLLMLCSLGLLFV